MVQSGGAGQLRRCGRWAMAERLQQAVSSGTKEKPSRGEGCTPRGTVEGCGLARRVPVSSLSPQPRGGSSTRSTRQAEAGPASATKAGSKSPVVAARLAAPCVPSPFGSACRVPITQAELSKQQPPSSCTPRALRLPTAAKKTPLAERNSPLTVLAKRHLSSPAKGTVGGCGLARRVPLHPRSPQQPWAQGTSPARSSTRQAEGGPASATKAGYKSPAVAARIAAPCVPSPFGSARRVPVTQLTKKQPPFSRTPRVQRQPAGARQDGDRQGGVHVPPGMGGAQLGCSPSMAPGPRTALERLPASPLELFVSPLELSPSPMEESRLEASQDAVTSLDTGRPPGSPPTSPTGSPCGHRPPRWLKAPGHSDLPASSGDPVEPQAPSA